MRVVVANLGGTNGAEHLSPLESIADLYGNAPMWGVAPNVAVIAEDVGIVLIAIPSAVVSDEHHPATNRGNDRSTHVGSPIGASVAARTPPGGPIRSLRPKTTSRVIFEHA